MCRQIQLTFIHRIDDLLSSGTHTITTMNLAYNNFETFATNLARWHPIEELDM